MAEIFDTYARGLQMGEQTKRRKTLGQYFQGATQGDANALSQVYQVDPEAGMQAQQYGQAQRKQQQDMDTQEILRAARFYTQTKSPQAWSYIHSKVSSDPRFQGLPAQIDTPENQQGSIEFANALINSMGGSGMETPTAVRQFEMMAKAAGLKPGTPEYQRAASVGLGIEGRASSAGIGFDTITGADGRQRVVRQNPRTGGVEVFDESSNSFVPLGGMAGGGTAAPTRATMEGDIALANQMIASGIPPEQVDAFLMSRGQAAPQMPTANPALGVGRSKEEEAAAVTAAQEAAKLQFAPQFAQVDVNAAAAKRLAESQAERQASREKRASDSADMLDVLNQAERLIPQATGSRAGSAVDTAAGIFGYTPEGAKAAAQLDILAAKLVAQVPRFEGPQSNIDVLMYQQAAGDLANRNKTRGERLAALQQMRRLAEKYAGKSSTGRPASPVSQPRAAPKANGWSIQRVD